MAKHNVLFEIDNFIATKCINRAGIAETDIDGGTALTVGAISATDKEVYTVSKAEEEATRVAIAFNPSVLYEKVGDNYFPALSQDDRNYTNYAGKVLDFFFPEVGICFGITAEGIVDAGEEEQVLPTVGKFLEPTASGYAIKDDQTEGVASFKVVEIRTNKYPTFTFNEDDTKVYVLETVYNG